LSISFNSLSLSLSHSLLSPLFLSFSSWLKWREEGEEKRGKGRIRKKRAKDGKERVNKAIILRAVTKKLVGMSHQLIVLEHDL
jgi:hypothetical protein